MPPWTTTHAVHDPGQRPAGTQALTAFPAMVSQQKGADTVVTGLLPDRSALYGILAEIETLSLDLVEVRKLCTWRLKSGY